MGKMVKNLKHILIIVVLIYIVIKKSNIQRTIIKIDRFVADMKHILLWKNVHQLEGDGQSYFINHRCQFYNCYFTKNRTLFGDVRYFDVIVFNLQDVSENLLSLPKQRGSMQKYVFLANNSADNYPVCDEKYDNFFNWTWTYRYDSTLPYRFITIYNMQYEELGSHFQWYGYMKPVDATFKSQFATKSKAAVIFLDKCLSNSKREVLVNNLHLELLKYNLSVDIFGECGPKKCKRKNMNPCFWRLKKTYYFYLAFEDSIAYDYITDIVLYAYNNNAVPIVYGGARYDLFLPPGSFLSARNITVKDLAYGIQKIMADKQKYFDFFRWRNHYVFGKVKTIDACKLCEALNNPARLVQKNTINRFRRWWNPSYEKKCQINRKEYFIL